MLQKEKIKAIAFDFGGTLDSPFLHWMKIYLHVYADELQLPVTSDNFYDSYVYAERELERLNLIQPNYSLLQTQRVKVKLQLDDLVHRGILLSSDVEGMSLLDKVSSRVAAYSGGYIESSKRVLKELSGKYKLLLVSNYYGNLKQIVEDFGLSSYFLSITDSTIVGIRKPDTLIWKKAIVDAGFTCDEVLIVGDSMKNDIKPGIELGCQVVQGCPSAESTNREVDSIFSVSELLSLL